MATWDANELDPASSDGSETLDVHATVENDGIGEIADSSSAEGEPKEKDTLSLVRDVVGEEEQPESKDAASPAEGEEETGDEEGDQKETADEWADVPFNKHPRFQQLVKRVNAAEQDAGRYRNVQSFMDQNGLSAEDTAEGLVIMGLMKTNPVEAWKALRPTVQKLLVAAGEVLPDDIQQRVQAGELPEAAAFELSRQRAGIQSMSAQRSFEEQRAARDAQTNLATSLYGAAQAWEADRKSKDPNFEAKLVPLQKELAYLHATEGKPETPQGVCGQLKRAYEAVNASFRPPVVNPRPAPRPATRPTQSGQVSGTTRPDRRERSTLDIIRDMAG